jgi:hypothetical protein
MWPAAAVWVVFWSLYPTFGRPRAFHAAIRTAVREMDLCDQNPGPGQRACYVTMQERLDAALGEITLRNEYAGYAPVGLGVGLGVPLAAGLALAAVARRRVGGPR